MSDQPVSDPHEQAPRPVSTLDVEQTLLCPECGYNLTGLPEDRCPECGLGGAIVQARRLSKLEHYRRGRRWWAGIAGAVFLAFFGVNLFLPLPELLGDIAIGFCAYWWIRMDCAAHQYPSQRWTLFLAFLIAPVGLPVYFLLHRRWRSLAWFLLYVLGLFAACIVLGLVCCAVCWALGLPQPL